MSDNANTDKEPTLGVVQGGEWGTRKSWAERSGCKRPVVHVPNVWEEALKRAVKTVADTVRTQRGAPSRQWYKIVTGDAACPFGVAARRVIEAQAAGASDESIQAFADAFSAWTETYLASKRQTRMVDGRYSNEPNSPRAA